MKISEEKINKIKEIKKIIQENKINEEMKELTLGELIDKVFDKCSTPEKQNSFIFGIVMGMYGKEFCITKSFVNTFNGGFGTLEYFLNKYPDHYYKEFLK